MRKLIIQQMVSVDGYFEGPNNELDWHVVDGEFNDFAIDALKKIDTLIFGRITYNLMANYWPSPAAVNDDPVVANFMNKISKIVFSKTLEKLEWENCRLVKTDPVEEVKRLKSQKGKEIAIFGSSHLALPLIENNLIDEYRIIVNPVILGRGISLFAGTSKSSKLKLVESRIFNSGNVLLIYTP